MTTPLELCDEAERVDREHLADEGLVVHPQGLLTGMATALRRACHILRNIHDSALAVTYNGRTYATISEASLSDIAGFLMGAEAPQ